MTSKKTTTIVLCCGLIAVVVTSLLVREVFFVRIFSLLALGLIAAVGIFVSRGLGRMVILAGTLFFAILAFTNAPLRAAFLVYESRFDVICDEILLGKGPEFPTWVGPFRVIDGGVREGSGAPYLMTSGYPSEINGFVRDPQGTYFNLWSITPLGERWAYIEED